MDKAGGDRSLTADNLLTTYLGLYLGITFLITSGAVLAIQQLAHSADNVKRYKLLKTWSVREGYKTLSDKTAMFILGACSVGSLSRSVCNRRDI